MYSLISADSVTRLHWAKSGQAYLPKHRARLTLQRSILVTTSTSNIIVMITRRISRILFLSHMTKFALSRVKGLRDFNIRKSMMASSLLKSPLSTRISPVTVFSNLWRPTQKGFEYLLFTQRSNSSCSVDMVGPS
jgi:hypothetical protein